MDCQYWGNMNGYTKIFGSMLDSTVWQLSKEARLLWITMLLKKNREQIVRSSIPGLAHAARLTLEETESALEELQTPDKYSQSKEHEGKRVVLVDGGWFVVNGQKYRNLMTKEDRREYNRQKKAEERERNKGQENGKPKKKRKISIGSGPSARERHYDKQIGDGEDPDAPVDKGPIGNDEPPFD